MFLSIKLGLLIILFDLLNPEGIILPLPTLRFKYLSVPLGLDKGLLLSPQIAVDSSMKTINIDFIPQQPQTEFTWIKTQLIL